MIWVIVLKMTVVNLGAPALMSNFAFTSQQQCLVAIAGEPGADRVTCRPLLAIPPAQQGEKVDP